MKIHPCAKINLGLNIVERRPDGYHNLETVFYPIGIHDTIEISQADTTTLRVEEDGMAATGEASASLVSENPEKNLVMRAYRLLESDFELPPVSITLRKRIPMQAGMGGGSSDGAYALRLLNDLFHLNIDNERLRQYAATLGADCAFFVESRPAYAEGIGERLTPIPLDLSRYTIAIVKPDTPVSTKEAFANIRPQRPSHNCRDIVMQPIESWRGLLVNDFEQSIFALHPDIAAIKQRLYAMGAIYAAMSGSGSSVFGIFDSSPALDEFSNCYTNVLSLNC